MAKPNRSNVVVAAIAFAVADGAFAFNVSGVESGMSREQSSTALTKAGFRISQNQQDPNLLAASRDGATSVLKFCRNRLENYSFTLSGGVVAFIHQADMLTRARGVGNPEIASVDRGSPIDSFGLSWRKGSEYVKVSYVAASKANEESVSITYVDDSACR